MNFFKKIKLLLRLEIKELKILRKSIKNKNFNYKINTIAQSYFNKNNEEKIIIEYVLNDCVVDIEKASFLSMATAFLIPSIKEMFPSSYSIITYFALYIFMAGIIIFYIKLYRFYKTYLKVIEDIKSGLITKEKKEIECIGFKNILEKIERKNFEVKKIEVAMTEDDNIE